MDKMHYYQHHIGDLIKDTSNLSNEQLAVYLKMMWIYYTSEKPFTEAAEDIAFSVRSDEKTVGLILRHFFVEQEDGWHQTRCDKEIAFFHNKAEKARESANARWSNANALQTQSKRNAKATKSDANQQPITNNQVIQPASVSDEVWNSFVKHRKAKKALVTELVIKGIEKQAESVGWTLQDALIEVVERGWSSFKADWVKGKGGSSDYDKMMGRA